MINSETQARHIFKRSVIRRAILSCILFSTAPLLFGFSNTSYANGSTLNTSNIDKYDASFFMVFDPQTLYDILEKIPGANSLLNSMNGASQNRGFGSAGDQILINSKRVPGKENSISKELDNIQAKDVDYIELIRGTRSDLDVQSNGLVINVVLKKDIESSILWTLASVKTADISPQSIGSLIYSDGIDNLKYRIGLNRSINPNELSTIDQFTSPEKTHTHTYTRLRENLYKKTQLSAKLEYLHSEQTSLQLNAIFEKIDVDAKITNDIEYRVTNQLENKALFYDWARDKWEISGDISHELNDDNHLKLMFISNKADSDDKTWHISSQGGNEFKADYQLPRVYTSKENVLRTNWRHKLDSRHTFDSGVEVAVNQLNENLQYISESGAPYHSSEFNDIKETRYEAFSNYNFTLSSDLNLQLSLIYERSTIDVKTDLAVISDTIQNAQSNISRTFSYLKPRLNIRYDLDDIYQIRFNYQRTVSQLNLKDFVPWFDSYESRLEETNPDLKPEVRDELSVGFEKQWQKTSGSLTLTPYYHKISDLITEVLLVKRSGDGNIDHGKEYGIKLDTSFGLEALGLNNTLISANYTWRHSEMIHPFTGNKAPIERISENEWNVRLNQNELLPGLSFSLTVENKSRYEFYYYDYQGNLDTKLSANAFIDYQISKNVKVRLKGDNLLHDKYTINRTRHTGLFTQSDILRQEHRKNERAPRFSISLTGQF